MAEQVAGPRRWQIVLELRCKLSGQDAGGKSPAARPEVIYGGPRMEQNGIKRR